jgi:hypothetical protein
MSALAALALSVSSATKPRWKKDFIRTPRRGKLNHVVELNF